MIGKAILLGLAVALIVAFEIYCNRLDREDKAETLEWADPELEARLK